MKDPSTSLLFLILFLFFVSSEGKLNLRDCSLSVGSVLEQNIQNVAFKERERTEI